MGEIKLAMEILKRYPDTSASTAVQLIAILDLVGFGRNKNTAAGLRAVADLIEADIASQPVEKERL